MNELERRLAEAAPDFPFPPTPALARTAAARLPGQQSRRSPLLLGLAAALIAVAAVLAFSSGARSAVLDWLDAIPGVRIERTEKLPESRLMPAVDFGSPVSLETARRRAGFPVLLPNGLGEPTAVQLDRGGGGTAVTMRFDRRLVLTEWRASAVLFEKMISFDSNVEPTKVGDDDGLWISGGDHAVFYLGVDTKEHFQPGRLAGNVLLWHDGLVGYRIETAASKRRALELAESLGR